MRILLTLALLFFVLSELRGQFSPKEVQEDLQILYKKILKFHPGPFAYTDSTKFNEQYFSLLNGMDGDLSLLEAYKILNSLVLEIKDLHTGVYLPKGTETHSLPFILNFYDEIPRVVYNLSTDSLLARGTELVSIEGESVTEVFQEIRGLYNTDNGNDVAKDYYGVRRFHSKYFTLKGLKDSIHVQYVLGDTVHSSYLKPIWNKQVIPLLAERYPEKLTKNFTYSILDSTQKVGELNITSFKEKAKIPIFSGNKFRRKLKEVMAAIEKDSVEHLVLDLRGNGGGSISNIARLSSYFIPKKYFTMDTMAIKKKAFLKAFPLFAPPLPLIGLVYFNKRKNGFLLDLAPKKPKNKPKKKHFYSGKLYAFLDGGSYSATIFTTAILKENVPLTILGTRGGGAKWGSFAGQWVSGKLPNTRIKYRIPLFKIVHNIPKTKHTDFFIEPDVELNYALEDLIDNKDSFQEGLLQFIQSTKTGLDRP